jgi:hypothetical protein
MNLNSENFPDVCGKVHTMTPQQDVRQEFAPSEEMLKN